MLSSSINRIGVLLCHRRDIDYWNLPGGGVENGETPWLGVIREVMEEVGLEVEIDRLAGVYSKPHRDEVVFNFVCRVQGGHLTTSEEADAVEFFRLEELPSNTIPKQAERIRDIFNARGDKPTLKVQDGPSVREQSSGN